MGGSPSMPASRHLSRGERQLRDDQLRARGRFSAAAATAAGGPQPFAPGAAYSQRNPSYGQRTSLRGGNRDGYSQPPPRATTHAPPAPRSNAPRKNRHVSTQYPPYYGQLARPPPAVPRPTASALRYKDPAAPPGGAYRRKRSKQRVRFATLPNLKAGKCDAESDQPTDSSASGKESFSQLRRSTGWSHRKFERGTNTTVTPSQRPRARPSDYRPASDSYSVPSGSPVARSPPHSR